MPTFIRNVCRVAWQAVSNAWKTAGPVTRSDYDTTDFGAYVTTDAGNYQVID